jgi:hypothetical protein
LFTSTSSRPWRASSASTRVVAVIAGEGGGVPAERLDGPRALGQCALVSAGQPDVGPDLAEGLGHAAAHAATRAGDQRNRRLPHPILLPNLVI